MNHIAFFDDGRFSEYVVGNVIKTYLKEDDVFFDGGANKGVHTLRALTTGAQVYAFEPIPVLARKLRETGAGGAMRSGQCEVIEVAFAAGPGVAEFTYCPERSTLSGLKARARLSELETTHIKVEVTTIDDVIQSRVGQAPALIKLDLEGGEYDAIRGARNAITAAHPVLIFEHGGNEGARLYNYTHEQYWEMLRGLGYTIFQITGRNCTLDDFRKPRHWNFLALDLSQPRHVALLENLDYLVADAAQKMALLHDVKTSV